MPPKKHRRRWHRKGMCCIPMPRPCIDSMPRHCMPYCSTCRPCPSSQHAAAASSSHSSCSCEEEKYCTIDNCKNAPMCINAKLRYCPYGFRDKGGADQQIPDRRYGKEMLVYHPSQEREMRAHHPQAASTPYMQSGPQPAPEFTQSGYPAVPIISSIDGRSPDQFDQSMPQYAQQLPRPQVNARPLDAAQAPVMHQDFGPPESQTQGRERILPIFPESQGHMPERMMPISPKSQAQMQERMMPISPESQAQMQERMMPISPESQAQMHERLMPRPDTLSSPVSVSSGPSSQIRKMADQFQPYYGQPHDKMPGYDYVASRGPIPQEEGYANIPRAEKQVGGYTPGQFSLGPTPEDLNYPSGLPTPHFDHGHKYSLSAVSSADRIKPRPIVIQDEPRRIPQYTSPTDYSTSDKPPTPSSRAKHGLILDTHMPQPVSDTSYSVRKDMPSRYVSVPQTSPAPSERIPSSRPMSTEGPSRTLYRPPYQPDTSIGAPYSADSRIGAPYHADYRMGVPHQADSRMEVPYQADSRMGAPYQADSRMEAPYQADTRMETPYQTDTQTGVPQQADTRIGYQPGIERPQERERYIAEPVPKKSVHHALPDTIKTSTMNYDTELPAKDREDMRSLTTDRSRSVYHPMPSGYDSIMESPQSMDQSFPSRYPLGQPLAESTTRESSRSIPLEFSAGPPLSPVTSVRMGESKPQMPTDGLHKISYRTPSTGYNKFCKEPSQPEYIDTSIGFEYPVPQTSEFISAGTQDEMDAPKCSCRYPPAFKHLECAGLMSGTCECNENDL